MIRKPVPVRLEGRGRFIGGLLLGAGLFWLLWLLFFHAGGVPINSQWSIPAVTTSPLPAALEQSTPLTSAGIMLSPPANLQPSVKSRLYS
ncbi:hypothetical protein [Dictyobacter kobayashii]|uniref:hypothetical protein n=1 Tax=Dictyobacter kobayashii TaxID=2014872 RepID=UPI000F818528|nr:hypothetical protein [Dictyobacter kobayashii]